MCLCIVSCSHFMGRLLSNFSTCKLDKSRMSQWNEAKPRVSQHRYASKTDRTASRWLKRPKLLAHFISAWKKIDDNLKKWHARASHFLRAVSSVPRRKEEERTINIPTAALRGYGKQEREKKGRKEEEKNACTREWKVTGQTSSPRQTPCHLRVAKSILQCARRMTANPKSRTKLSRP